LNQKARELMTHLDKLYIAADKTRKQLKASLDIQLLWPEAFKNGNCTSYLGGNMSNMFEFKTMRFIIKNGIGETREFKLMDIPDYLLKRAIEFQKKPNGHNRSQCSQLDKLYNYVQTVKKRKE
jgi:hypothetical protein